MSAKVAELALEKARREHQQAEKEFLRAKEHVATAEKVCASVASKLEAAHPDEGDKFHQAVQNLNRAQEQVGALTVRAQRLAQQMNSAKDRLDEADLAARGAAYDEALVAARAKGDELTATTNSMRERLSAALEKFKSVEIQRLSAAWGALPIELRSAKTDPITATAWGNMQPGVWPYDADLLELAARRTTQLAFAEAMSAEAREQARKRAELFAAAGV